MTSRFRPQLIGVLNLSPESTVPGSVASTPDSILERAAKLANNGADYIEIGARSINARAPMIDETEEQARLLPALQSLRDAGYRIVVETWSALTAMVAIDHGADIINFSSGTAAPELYRAAADAGTPLLLMYLPYADPYAMRTSTKATYDLEEILHYFREYVALARQAGCEQVIVDPNAGIFHPDVDDYEKIVLQLIAVDAIAPLRDLGCPVMLYCPRKESLTSRIIMAQLLLRHRVDYMRIHEPEIVRTLQTYER